METSGHTPTPWQVSGVRKKVTVNRRVTDSHVIGPDNDGIALAFYAPEHHAEMYANAHFIVRAVNNHEALIEALEDMIGWYATLRVNVYGIGADQGMEEIEDARRALAAARA